MTDDFDIEIRSTLAVMVAEAPDPLSLDDRDRQTASPHCVANMVVPRKGLRCSVCGRRDRHWSGRAGSGHSRWRCCSR